MDSETQWIELGESIKDLHDAYNELNVEAVKDAIEVLELISSQIDWDDYLY